LSYRGKSEKLNALALSKKTRMGRNGACKVGQFTSSPQKVNLQKKLCCGPVSHKSTDRGGSPVNSITDNK